MPIYYIMVQRKTLEKLSDYELQLYLKPTSRYIAEAIDMAFDILKNRGILFSEEETLRIKNLIKTREKEEIEKEKELEFEEHITEDVNAFPLYSRHLIVTFCILFGTISGALLLAINCFKLKKHSQMLGVLFFGIVFTVLQITIFPLFMEMNSDNFTPLRKSPELLFGCVGGLILFFLWSEIVPKKFVYKEASFLIPILIAILMTTLLFTNYNNYFVSFLLQYFIK